MNNEIWDKLNLNNLDKYLAEISVTYYRMLMLIEKAKKLYPEQTKNKRNSEIYEFQSEKWTDDDKGEITIKFIEKSK